MQAQLTSVNLMCLNLFERIKPFYHALIFINFITPPPGTMTAAEADEAASSKWLATRSKPCPSCKAPIEKTEGCNHMCCKKVGRASREGHVMVM